MAMSGKSDLEQSERQRGVTTIVVVTALLALLACGALAIDVGLIWESRTQIQNASDASALAAARLGGRRPRPRPLIPHSPKPSPPNKDPKKEQRTKSNYKHK